MKHARKLALLALLVAGVAAVQCGTPSAQAGDASAGATTQPAADGGGRPWDTIYAVLQHPRCVNCHPAGDVPLQGDDHRPHAQNVQRGPDGEGLYAMRCSTCHQEHNLAGPKLPPGAPHWKLPTKETPLVFEGRSSSELCEQLRDPARNGGKSPQDLLHHTEDALVLWGWKPGEGRTPVSTPYADFVAAMRAWVESGCDCPER
jgi:hypothetical protein